MPRHVLASVVLMSGLTLAAFHAHFKRQPSAGELSAAARRWERPSSWQGKLAPDFELDTREGRPFRLADHIGRQVVILNFFATWCGPCKAEMPELNRFVSSRHEDPILLLGIDAGESPAALDAFMKEVAVTYPVAIDEGAVQRKYGVDSFPTTVLIGADGRVQLYEAGAIMNTDVALAALLEPNLEQLRSNHGISQRAYLEELAKEDYGSVADTDASSEPLDARSTSIAEQMSCPCGCSHTVLACTCHTARQIKERLRIGRFRDKNDAQVMQELNREFCMKGMP